LKGAKNSKEKIFLWAILMFLRPAFGSPHALRRLKADLYYLAHPAVTA